MGVSHVTKFPQKYDFNSYITFYKWIYCDLLCSALDIYDVANFPEDSSDKHMLEPKVIGIKFIRALAQCKKLFIEFIHWYSLPVINDRALSVYLCHDRDTIILNF